jgi:putative transferase (TIGR04331 family)
MSDISIVASAIEETWPSEGKIIFLGQWCCIYSRKDKWQKMNYEIAEYHWDDREKLRSDYAIINKYYEFYLIQLTKKLNEIHKTDFSVRYWRILVGWWLFYFIGVLFDRWQIVKDVEKKYPNASTFCVSDSGANRPAQSMKEFVNLVTQDVFWNESIFASLIKNFSTLDFQEVQCQPKKDFLFETDMKKWKKIPRKIKDLAIKVIFFLIERNVFYGNGISIESSYLSKFNLLKLFLINRQLPYRLNFEPLKQFSYSSRMRDWSLPSMSESEFDMVLDFFIPRHLPQTYVEGYRQIKISADEKLKKKKFKILITANDFSGNDAWAAWAARSVENGSKLVIMQHGGLYGVNTFSATEDHEIAIADKFLSWGWRRNDTHKVTPAPATKLIHMKKKPKFQNDGTALLIAGALPQQSYHLSSMPIGPQFATYFEDQFNFVSALSPDIKKKLRVRMFPSDLDWCQELRWKDFDPMIHILKDGKTLEHNLRKAKVSISTYNATTFLETFSKGIPTVMFWDENYWEINKTALPYYQKLQEAKILFYDPKECAKHVNEIWDNPLKWWNDVQTRNIVKEFSDNFANVPRNAISKLSEIINNDY